MTTLPEVANSSYLLMASSISYLILLISSLYLEAYFEVTLMIALVLSFASFVAYLISSFRSADAASRQAQKAALAHTKTWKKSLVKRLGDERHAELVYYAHTGGKGEKGEGGEMRMAELASALKSMGLRGVGRREVALLLRSIEEEGQEREGGEGEGSSEKRPDGVITLREFKSAINSWLESGQKAERLSHAQKWRAHMANKLQQAAKKFRSNQKYPNPPPTLGADGRPKGIDRGTDVRVLGRVRSAAPGPYTFSSASSLSPSFSPYYRPSSLTPLHRSDHVVDGESQRQTGLTQPLLLTQRLESADSAINRDLPISPAQTPSPTVLSSDSSEASRRLAVLPPPPPTLPTLIEEERNSDPVNPYQPHLAASSVSSPSSRLRSPNQSKSVNDSPDPDHADTSMNDDLTSNHRAAVVVEKRIVDRSTGHSLVITSEAVSNGTNSQVSTSSPSVKSMEIPDNAAIDDEIETEREGEEIEDELWHYTDQQLLVQAVAILIVGTLLCSIFSDPIIDVITALANRLNLSPFYISFVVTPFASAATEMYASITFARKKTIDSISLTLSTLHSSATVAGTLELTVFLIIFYVKDLSWDYTAEMISYLIVVLFVGLNGSLRKIYLWQGIMVASMYFLSIIAIWSLKTKFHIK